MKVAALLFSVTSGMLLATAKPIAKPLGYQDSSDFSYLAGPLPYDTLVHNIELAKTNGTIATASLGVRSLQKRTSAGVYLCDGQGFSGSCYYGSYPISTGIHPDDYWVHRIRSVGPDRGFQCYFYK
jgi:hypothetical protein